MPDDAAASSEPDPSSTLALEVVVHAGDWSGIPEPEKLAQTGAAAIASLMGPDCFGLVTVALSDDAEIRRLNGAWRGKDKATNVLSFPSRQQGGEAQFLGDVILAVETVMREADEQHIPPAHHFQHLVVHGLLHLLGYDHEDEAEAEEMESLEIEILGLIGVPDPYADALDTAN